MRDKQKIEELRQGIINYKNKKELAKLSGVTRQVIYDIINSKYGYVQDRIYNAIAGVLWNT